MTKTLDWLRTPVTLRDFCVMLIVAILVTIYQAANAAPAPAVYMPIIETSQAPVVTRLVTLVETDAGFVTATVIPNTKRVLVAYTDRRDGNALKIGEHIGDGIRPLEDPELVALARSLFADVLTPSYDFPGPKQGFGMIVIVGNEMRVYATSRDEGDDTGWFKVKVLISGIPPAPQG
jgi:hypothetical protein